MGCADFVHDMCVVHNLFLSPNKVAVDRWRLIPTQVSMSRQKVWPCWTRIPICLWIVWTQILLMMMKTMQPTKKRTTCARWLPHIGERPSLNCGICSILYRPSPKGKLNEESYFPRFANFVFGLLNIELITSRIENRNRLRDWIHEGCSYGNLFELAVKHLTVIC